MKDIDNQTLEKIISTVYEAHGRPTEWYLGYCADFAWSLNEFLGKKGSFFLVGKMGDGWASHIVLSYGGRFWDCRGSYPNAKAVNIATPSAAFNGDRLDGAGTKEIEHIKSLLHPEYVKEWVEELKQALKKIGAR